MTGLFIGLKEVPKGWSAWDCESRMSASATRRPWRARRIKEDLAWGNSHHRSDVAGWFLENVGIPEGFLTAFR